jgi:hypothetical protein
MFDKRGFECMHVWVMFAGEGHKAAKQRVKSIENSGVSKVCFSSYPEYDVHKLYSLPTYSQWLEDTLHMAVVVLLTQRQRAVVAP